MKMATVHLQGTSALSFSRYIQAEKKPKELAEEFEKRCWRERIHRDKDGRAWHGAVRRGTAR